MQNGHISTAIIARIVSHGRKSSAAAAFSTQRGLRSGAA
jgi:hypothetical protein